MEPHIIKGGIMESFRICGGYLGIAVGIMLLAISLLAGGAVAEDAVASFSVEAYSGDWQTVSVEHFPGQPYPDRYATKLIELPEGTTKVRLTQKGTDTAHIDAALLDGNAPDSVIDRSTDVELPPAKLAKADYDVVDAVSRTIEIAWAKPGTKLSLTAVEENITGVPVSWPKNNYLKYKPGEPETFSQFIIPFSSHPASTFYATFSTTSKELLVNLDATGDNTFDPEGDWAELRVLTPEGLKKFRISNTDTTWGTSAYEYTDKVVWQHKTYQISIPLGEISASPGDEIEFQIGYYGTFAWPSEGTIRDLCTGAPISGAEVTLLKDDGSGNFIKAPLNNIISPSINPEFTLTDGNYSWTVNVSGTFKVKAERDGYVTAESPAFTVGPGAINLDIILAPIDGCQVPAISTAGIVALAGMLSLIAVFTIRRKLER